MFTGIVDDIGVITSLQKKAKDIAIEIQTSKMDLSQASAGDSIAVNGVCLTMVTVSDKNFMADISGETLSTTTLDQLVMQSNVNLEKPLTLNTVLGGHMVSGHVDGIATVIAQQNDGRSEKLTFEVDVELAKYIAQKGSVCLDGVSLTVNDVNANRFDVNIIPYTQQETTFKDYKVGSTVNIEVDIIARYLERLTHITQ